MAFQTLDEHIFESRSFRPDLKRILAFSIQNYGTFHKLVNFDWMRLPY